MKLRTLTLKLTIAGIILSLNAGGQVEKDKVISPMKLTGIVPLPGVSGRIDHLAFNSKAGIVYVAALGNNSVEAVDLNSRKVIHSIKGLNEPQGIRYIPENNTIVVANGGNGKVDSYNATTFKLINSVYPGDDADNVRYDPGTGTVYVGYGSGAIAGLDANSLAQKFKIELPGHPESFQLSGEGRIFVNIPEARLLDVIDLNKRTIAEKWEIKEAKSNFPLAVDGKNHRLFVGCRNPAKLLVIDSRTGKISSELNIDSDTDDLYYDEKYGQIYVSSGGGYIDIIRQINPDRYELLSKIKTSPGARTSLFIQELEQLVVAAPARPGKNASLMIYGRSPKNF